MFNFLGATQYLTFNPVNKLLSTFNKNEVKKEDIPVKEYQSQNEHDINDISAIKDTIKYMESRGEQDPYSFSQPSGIKELGDALGAYQITEAKLRENAKRFLGKSVSKDEFLNNPELQDKYIESEIKYLLDSGFKVNSLFSAHRGGWSDLRRSATEARNKKYQQYMNEATQKYKEFLNTKEKDTKKLQSRKKTTNKIFADLSEIKNKLNEPQEFDVEIT